MAKARIVKHNGYPAISIDGKIYPPMMATIVSSRVPLGGTGRTVDSAYYKALGEAGIKIYYVMCNNPDMEDCAVRDFENEVNTILSEIPDAYIMVRIPLTPSKKWMEENPDHIVSYNDGHKIPTTIRTESFVVEADGMPSLCSRKWREDMSKTLLQVIREIDKLPCGSRVVGYFVGGGGNSEWFYINPLENWKTGSYGDTSGAFSAEFKNYLDEKYGKDTVSAEIPGLDSRFFANRVDEIIANPGRRLAGMPAPEPPANGTNYGSFLDMDRYFHTFDFYRAWTEGSANSILHFAKLIKENRPDTLVGSFYGSMGGSEIITASNSSAVRKILDSGYVDFLANPGVYENRQPGGFTGQRQCPDSFRLRNTMYMVEDDTRTHAENLLNGELFRMFSLADTVNVLKRDFGRNICEDLQSWWYDQHIGGGRYKSDAVYALFAKQQKIAEFAYSLDRRKENEIAFLYDEESVHTASRQSTDDCVQVIRNYEIANIGAGVDSYFHNDVANPAMPDYKLYVFCNCFYLTDRERADIQAKLRKNHAVALFLYGNGLINPDREKKLSVAHISELTGIRCRELMDKRSPLFRIDEGVHSVSQKLDSTKLFGAFLRKREGNLLANSSVSMPRSYLYPVIYPDDPDATVIGHFAQENLPAVAVKEADGYTAVYCGTKYVSADFIREIARFAGCHIYDEGGHVVYASKNFITVHAAYTGKVHIRFREKCTPFEMYEEQNYGQRVTEMTYDAKIGETKMFYINREVQ